MKNSIKSLKKKAMAIANRSYFEEKVEVDLKDTSKSLHALTNQVQIELLAEDNHKIEHQVKDLTHKLSILIEKNSILKSIDMPSHKKILDQLIFNSEQIDAIWTNDGNGNFIYSNPPAGLNNAIVRDWFNESMKGTTYVSNIYISAISKLPCITISLPIFNRSHQVIGVLGADIGIHTK